MNAGVIVRLGVLASGVAVSVTMAFAGIAQADPLTGRTGGSSAIGAVTGGGGDDTQHLGCERTKKPNCNRPGRRSSHR